MIRKLTTRIRWLVLVCALAGAVVGTGGSRFISYAQGDGYFCPHEYQTCSSDWGMLGGDPGEFGGGGGSTSPCDNYGGAWKCPIRSESSNDNMGGSGTCTSTGCKRSSSAPDSYWVCAFTASDTATKCPPLEACECR